MNLYDQTAGSARNMSARASYGRRAAATRATIREQRDQFNRAVEQAAREARFRDLDARLRRVGR